MTPTGSETPLLDASLVAASRDRIAALEDELMKLREAVRDLSGEPAAPAVAVWVSMPGFTGTPTPICA